MRRIPDLLKHLKEVGGSDLHLLAGIAPRARVHGDLNVIPGWEQIHQQELLAMMREIVNDKQWEEFTSTGDMDMAYGLNGVARFRTNYFTQENGAGAIFRMIPEDVTPLENLNMPNVLESFAHMESGLILVTGPTGSGKSTTLAAIIDKINKTYAKHIVTIEDPIEFVHRNKLAIVSHREVGTHSADFASALRAAVRQDADVVVVGEMRDLETISLAITAAEMGSLVFGTLHTNSASKTIDRLIDAFPADQQAQVRTTLSESLAGVCAQLLIQTADGKGRCAVSEILLRTPGLPNLIREGKTQMINSIIQSGRGQGMQSMDDALLEAVHSGKVRAADAYLKATKKALFEQFM